MGLYCERPSQDDDGEKKRQIYSRMKNIQNYFCEEIINGSQHESART